MVTDFLSDQSYKQLVTGTTRTQLVNMEVKRSLLDIVYSNKEDKILGVYKDDIGRSDHQGVRVVVATRSKQPKPQCIRMRSYRRFDVVKFLYEVQVSQLD